jgi:DNA-directed RNA polymerase alpha subunit
MKNAREEQAMDKHNTLPESELPKMSKPANRGLQNAGYHKLEQITEVTEAEILKIHGVGPKAIRILNEVLMERGLSFKKD